MTGKKSQPASRRKFEVLLHLAPVTEIRWRSPPIDSSMSQHHRENAQARPNSKGETCWASRAWTSQAQNVPTQKMPATQHDRKTDLLFGSPRFSLCWAGCEPRNNLGCSGRRSSRVTEDNWWGTIKILQCHHHKKITEQSLGYGTDHCKLVSSTFLLA